MKAITLLRETAKISTCLKIVFIREMLFRVERNSLESGYWSSLINSLSNDTEIPLVPSGLLQSLLGIVSIIQGLKLLKIL